MHTAKPVTTGAHPDEFGPPIYPSDEDSNAAHPAREKRAEARHLIDAIVQTAIKKWMEESEFGGNVDASGGTVTIGAWATDGELATYRYEFDENGGIHIWDEAGGEERPEELADVPDADR